MITSLVFPTYNQFNTMDTFKESLYTSVSIIPTCGIHYAETTKAWKTLWTLGERSQRQCDAA